MSHQTVASILRKLEYSLQGDRRTKEGSSHQDRDEQFKYINKSVKKFIANKDSVIAVNTKKKEMVSNYKNTGKELRKKGVPEDVNCHDFPSPKAPKTLPYGVYVIDDNSGWVNVGISADTAEFAVEGIRHWWRTVRNKKYLTIGSILIYADSGGSNSYRSKLWKGGLQKFCDDAKIMVFIRHFPLGKSKWNKHQKQYKNIHRAKTKSYHLFPSTPPVSVVRW